MGNFKFVLNRKGVGELLHSSEMQNALMSYGRQVADSAGDGYEVKQMPTRAIAVSAFSKKAQRDNLKNNTLLKVVGRSK